MLYDPKWEVQTKPDVFSLESLIAWLEKQPADTEYNFGSIRNCLTCQYFRAMGLDVYSAGGTYVRLRGRKGDDRVFHDFGRISAESDRTFGGALERARAASSAAK